MTPAISEQDELPGIGLAQDRRERQAGLGSAPAMLMHGLGENDVAQ